MQKRFDKTYTCDILVNTQAEVAELADALDSKSGALWACGFDSHLRYHLIYRSTSKWSFFIAGIRNPMRYSCNLNPFFVILFYVYADL